MTKSQPKPMQTQQTYKAGQRVTVLAGGELDHDFTGTVTRTDPDNYLIFAEDDETGEVWGMPECNITPAPETPQTTPAKPAHTPEQEPELIRRALEQDYIPKHEIMILGFALQKVRQERDDLLRQRDEAIAKLAQRDKDYQGCFEIREQYKLQRDALLAACKLVYGVLRHANGYEVSKETLQAAIDNAERPQP